MKKAEEVILIMTDAEKQEMRALLGNVCKGLERIRSFGEEVEKIWNEYRKYTHSSTPPDVEKRERKTPR